jgi:hypothetical protein
VSAADAWAAQLEQAWPRRVRLPGDTSWTDNDALCTVGSGNDCVVVPGPSQSVQVLHARTVDGRVNTDIRALCSGPLRGSSISQSACVIVSDAATEGASNGGLVI